MEKLARLYAETITGSHEPLWFGWSDLQLDTVADFLALPAANRRCIAAVVCSLVATYRSDGVGEVRYSRRKAQYSRYPDPDPLMAYRRVVPAVDYLIRQGWARGKKGGYWERKQSIVWATPELLILVGDLVDISARAVLAVDAIVLRNAVKDAMAFVDTDETRTMRAEMTSINNVLSAMQVYLDGNRVYVPAMSRIFNRNFDRGGRPYAQGPSWQNMPKSRREMFTMLVDGEITRTVERDFTTLHPMLAYAAAGKRLPKGDAYQIPNFPRPLVKVAFNILLNANSRRDALGAIIQKLRTDPDLRRHCELREGDGASLRKIADRVVTAIKRKHYRIRDCFGSDAGARFQKVDSDICVKVLLAMIRRTGRCPLPIHDSFIVAREDEQALVEEMDRALSQAYSDVRRAPSVKNTPTLPIHLGYQGSDQRQRDGGNGAELSAKGTAVMTSGRGVAAPSHGPPSTCADELRWAGVAQMVPP